MRTINVKQTDIHPTAVVHPWARLGRGVKIGPYTVIGENVKIGDGCRVGPNVLIEGNTYIGKNNRVFHGASIGTPPQDLKYDGEISGLSIGDNNTFREFVTVNAATGTGESTRIGNGNLIMAYAHIAHNCEIGNDVILANSVNLAGHVFIDDFAIIGGVTPVHQFVRVGRHSFVGGGSRVERDVPPFMKIAGSPPQVYGINAIGLERRGFDNDRRMRIKRMYKLLYRSNLNTSQALEELTVGRYRNDEDAATLAEFIAESMRGITK